MTKNVEDYFVPWVKGIPMYISGHIELAWRKPELHRLMSNENPHPPSQKVLDAIMKYGEMSNRYPDQGLVIRSRLAEINGLDGPENVMLGNGSSEVFDNIFRCFLQVGEEVIQHTPCFGIYKLRCNILGGKLVSVPMLYDGKELLFDVDAVLKAVTDKTKIIVIANPNNPTGNFMDTKDFIKIAETGIPFIVDEAYVEYAGLGMSQVGLIKKYKNVLITRTLSKAYGLAGMRFGYALGDKDVIGQISAALLPWNVGTIPMWAALAALEDTEALEERIRFNNSEVDFIEESLSDIPGLVILHSHGNYVLFDAGGTGKKGKDMVKYAEERGLILRPNNEMYGSDGWFRITVGLADENRMAVKVIREFLTQ
ncbi:MAG: histidinol-phosphate aminotransferase family protein [Anaerolineales bacterium]|nr:histidinol-phosphate aminotransferase family protein [Anaerolineales bacterium]